MERGPDWRYLPEPSKSLFIADSSDQEEATKKNFVAEGLNSNFVGGSCYLGVYLLQRLELEEWVKPQVEALANVVLT